MTFSITIIFIAIPALIQFSITVAAGAYILADERLCNPGSPGKR